MLVLTGQDVYDALSYDDCIGAIAAVMPAVSRGEALMPLRVFMPVPNSAGRIGWMPGALEQPRCCGIKVVSKFPTPSDGSRGSHSGVVLLFDSETGEATAAIDGAMLTALRTAAASAVATRALARHDASRLVLIGCGEQSWHHAHAIARVRTLREIQVWGRTPDKAHRFASALGASLPVDVRYASDPAVAVANADIVCTLTSSTTPVLRTEWLPRGCHVNLVGAAVRTSAEAEPSIVRRTRFFVDSRASALEQAGELLAAIAAGDASMEDVAGEIGELLDGKIRGRNNDQEITVYKSLGVAAQDLAAGFVAWQRARAMGHGTSLNWQAATLHGSQRTRPKDRTP